MIDPHWQVLDLDPVTWRNLGPYFPPARYIAAAQPGEHGLFVLHDHGRVLKVVDSQRQRLPAGSTAVIPAVIEDPRALALELYARGPWQRIHVIDKRHLAWVAQQAQAAPRRDLTLDAYYHLVYTLLWGDPTGYVCEPPHPGHWQGWTYAALRRFVADLPSPAALALGVYADDGLAIGLILVCAGGMIRRVTTFEGLDWHMPAPGPTPETLATLSAALEAQLAPAAAVLLCTDAVFSGWLAAPDKWAYLRAARANGSAIWQLAAIGGEGQADRVGSSGE